MSATAVTQIGGDGYNRGNIFTSAAAPTVNNDGTASPAHAVGDLIIDTTHNVVYRCSNISTGAAKWHIQGSAGEAQGVTTSAAAGSANVCNVTYQVVDALGAALAGVFTFIVFLSDAATGVGLTATTASGTVVAGASGTDLGDLTAKKAKVVQTDATGKYILSITDTVKTNFYPCAQIPGNGNTAVGTQLITGNYG